MTVETFAPILAFYQDDWLSVFVNRVVDFLAFLDSQVTGVFGDDFGRIKNVISEGLNER